MIEALEERYVDMDCEDFLEVVWGARRGWVDLPAKVSGYWVPFHTEWPNDGSISRRIDSSLRDREDLYYSVAQFAHRGRKIEDVLPTRWLWADLDEVHPTSGAKLGFLPTMAIESSPGRYQALWRLQKALAPRDLEKVNRGLSYALDADRGGWDLTQVLRIPGTRNFKYPEAPVVKILWYKPELEYEAKKIWARVKQAVPAAELAHLTTVELDRRPIPSKARALLRAGADQVVEGERSARLWELECMLAEAGLDKDEIFALVWPSAWNKWSGVNSGRERLIRDIKKAIQHVTRREALRDRTDRELADAVVQSVDSGDGDDGEDQAPPLRRESDSAGLPWVGYASFMAMAMEEPKWLIENIWTAGSHGFIAGEPKTNKTTIALALALSVASGASFLGRYSVGVQGPVLMVQEENAPWMMQDRLRKMAAYLGLISSEEAHVRTSGAGALGKLSVDLDFPVDLPLKLLNNYGFDLGVDEHREMLRAEVESFRPKLLILDPLYLIVPADSNNASDLRVFLKWIIKLRYEYDCAIAIVHHFRKQNTNGFVVRAGQRILGNTILHGFSDSALYLSALEEERDGWVRAQMETEFRAMAPQRPLEIALAMGDPGSLDMQVEIGTWNLEHAIRDIVSQEPGVTVSKLSEELGIDKRTVLSRVRGGELGMVIKGSKTKGGVRGRTQQTLRVYPGEGGDNSDTEE
jgi:hypothetical protein